MKIIAVTGTPGVGKSTIARLLSKELKYTRIDLSKHYQDISVGYNRSKKCYDVDIKKIQALIQKFATKHQGIIIDSHIAHLLPKKMINMCIVVTCSDLKKLEKRLVKRKYSPKKIRENLDSEIFQICLNEAKEKGHKIAIIANSLKVTKKEILNIVNKISQKKSPTKSL